MLCILYGDVALKAWLIQDSSTYVAEYAQQFRRFVHPLTSQPARMKRYSAFLYVLGTGCTDLTTFTVRLCILSQIVFFNISNICNCLCNHKSQIKKLDKY